jgi:hypothetical protein
MLTLFAIPKPFEGHSAVIQRNAVQSWKRLDPNCEIILCGDDPGVREAALEFKTKFLPDVCRNEYGTPLVSSAFEQAEQVATNPLLCYVNADIVLMSDFVPAVRTITFRRFLMVGQRWDLNLSQPIEFAKDDWEKHLRECIERSGSLQPPDGIDYFVFPSGTIGKLPPFAVGRPGWDNWFIYNARSLGVPVIDATKAVTVIHQNHDYAHVKHSFSGTVEGPEANRNRSLIAGWEYFFTIRDATHYLLRPTRLSSKQGFCRLRRRMLTLPVSVVTATNRIRPLIKRGVRVLRRLCGAA